MSTNPPQAVGMMTADALKRRLDQGEPLVLLDVREDDERAFCAITAGANTVDLHLPMAQVQAGLAIIEKAAGQGPLVVYCHHGIRSMVVARWLASRGVAGVQNLVGGIDAWSTQVDPAVPRY